MKLYKLTDENGRTRNGTQWGENITNHAKPGEPRLCSETVLHAYTDPHLVVLMAPAHVSWSWTRLWEAEGDVVADDGTKVGCKTLTTVHEIPLPEVTTEQRVMFAILCALEVCICPSFVKWARGWLSGADRSAAAAAAAAYVAARAAYAAAARAAYVAARAAYAAAARAAYAAARAAYAAAARAAYAAAARAAARAADAAAAAVSCASGADAAAAAVSCASGASGAAARAIPRHAAKLACGILEMG